MNELNWGNAHLILPDKKREAEQKYYQECYGYELTKAIKIAKKNSRRRVYRAVYHGVLA